MQWTMRDGYAPKAYGGQKYFTDRLTKDNARKLVWSHVKKGKLTKLPCEWPYCSSGDRAEAHHHDYDFPLEVIWLCKKHHDELHNNLGFFPTKKQLKVLNSA